MTSDPDQIRRDIEATRRDLATDVDTLHEKVSPSAIADRKMASAKGAVTSMKDKVMGSASSTGETAGDGMSAVGDRMSSVASTAGSTPSMARDRARGNPMAAGVIAFGAGWLISSLLPASEKEKQVARQAKDKVSEHSDTLTAPAKDAAQTMAENLKEPAQHAAESVKSTATDAAGTVQDTAKSAKDDVAGQAKGSTDQGRSGSTAGSSGTAGSSDLNTPVGSTYGGSSL